MFICAVSKYAYVRYKTSELDQDLEFIKIR